MQTHKQTKSISIVYFQSIWLLTSGKLICHFAKGIKLTHDTHIYKFNYFNSITITTKTKRLIDLQTIAHSLINHNIKTTTTSTQTFVFI